jgi:SP family facilitated glucose transporter-like MFS transporter 8
MIGLGTYMYIRAGWVAEDVQPKATWIPVACIFIFTIASTLGYLVVPWVMIGEVYPTQVKLFTSNIAFTTHLTLM